VGDGAHATIVRPAVVAFLNGHLRERSSARTQLDEAGNGSRLATVTRCRS
jgi:hypothetical protein